MALLRNDALVNNPYLRRYPKDANEWTRFVRELNSQEVGSIVLNNSAHIRQGQTDYDTGTGFWLGDDGGTAKLSIGDSTGDKLTWDGSELSLTANLKFKIGAIDSFTPIWSGFSSDPTTDVFYIDFGAFVIMRVSQTGYTGTSNATSFSFSGVPAAIQPGLVQRHSLVVVDNGDSVNGSILVNTDGTADLYVSDPNATTRATHESSGWTGSGAKGFAPGSIWLYMRS